MDVKGSILLFPELKNPKNGVAFITFTTSICRKRKDGNPIYKSMDVIFDPANFPDKKLEKLDPNCYYLFDVKEGWITVDSYTDRTGKVVTKFVLFVKDGKPTETRKRSVPAAQNQNPETDW